jgi:hypothetical protein
MKWKTGDRVTYDGRPGVVRNIEARLVRVKFDDGSYAVFTNDEAEQSLEKEG